MIVKRDVFDKAAANFALSVGQKTDAVNRQLMRFLVVFGVEVEPRRAQLFIPLQKGITQYVLPEVRWVRHVILRFFDDENFSFPLPQVSVEELLDLQTKAADTILKLPLFYAIKGPDILLSRPKENNEANLEIYFESDD